MMMKIRTLTAAEEQIMRIVWKMDSGYLREIIAECDEPKPHQNTVSTFLKILVEKEFLTTSREGRVFRYSAAIPEKSYREFILQDLLQRYYNGNASELLNELLMTETLDPNSAQEIINAADKIDENSGTENNVTDLVDEIINKKKKKKKKDSQKKSKKKKKDY